jgi:hypothetical protein
VAVARTVVISGLVEELIEHEPLLLRVLLALLDDLDGVLHTRTEAAIASQSRACRAPALQRSRTYLSHFGRTSDEVDALQANDGRPGAQVLPGNGQVQPSEEPYTHQVCHVIIRIKAK